MTGPVLRLRAARPDDADAVRLTAEVQRWYVEIYGGEDDDPLVADDFAPPRGRFLIGSLDGEALAMGGWTRTGADAKVRRMYVRPAARRHGVAGALLDELERLAREDGAERMVLETGSPQVAAVAFYRGRGYADVPAFGFHAASPLSVHLGKRLRRDPDPPVRVP